MVTAYELRNISVRTNLHKVLVFATQRALNGCNNAITRITLTAKEIEKLEDLGFTVEQEDECLIIVW